MTSSSGPSPFLVSYPGTVRTELLGVVRRAKQIGIEQQVLAAIRSIDERLHNSPMEFGEANYRLKIFEVRVSVVPPLAVYYGVDEAHRLVVVSAFRVLPSSGL